MAVVLGLVSANWFMVARKYTQDVFQERNLVYFGALYGSHPILHALTCAGLHPPPSATRYLGGRCPTRLLRFGPRRHFLHALALAHFFLRPFVCRTVLLLAVATMMYGLHWGAIEPTAAEQALQSCTAGTTTSCYNSDVANPQTRVSGCIKFGSALTGGTVPGGRPPPTVLGQNCMVWSNLTLTFAQVSLAQSPSLQLYIFF
jgi:hypothetical protein